MTIYQSTSPVPKYISGTLKENSIWTYLNDTTGEKTDYITVSGDGGLYGKWGSRNVGTPGGVVTYKFAPSLPPIYNEFSNDFKASFETMNDTDKAMANDAFQRYSNVASIQFQEVTAADDYGQISMFMADDGISSGMTQMSPISDDFYYGVLGSGDAQKKEPVRNSV